MTVEIVIGDALERLREMPDRSVHCAVTSPPYWGLRDYGHPDQIGLEPTPDAWVARLVEVFREVRRVLRDDGTFWLNVGDSFTSGNRVGHGTRVGYKQQTNRGMNGDNDPERPPQPPGLKPKDLIGLPWMLAFALRGDGWYLRSDIVWSKKSPMPESVRDRPTKAHEYVFLLTKRERYFFDQEAVKEPAVADHPSGNGFARPARLSYGGRGSEQEWSDVGGTRNIRSVWHLGPEAFPESHFAVMPTELARRCILAGTSAKGVCPDCGAPWTRVVEQVGYVQTRWSATNLLADEVGGTHRERTHQRVSTTTGWSPSCSCPAATPVPATVLDPFGGAGTTGLVADQLGRDAILIELSPDYAAMAARRIERARARRFIGDADPRPAAPGQIDLFAS